MLTSIFPSLWRLLLMRVFFPLQKRHNALHYGNILCKAVRLCEAALCQSLSPKQMPITEGFSSQCKVTSHGPHMKGLTRLVSTPRWKDQALSWLNSQWQPSQGEALSHSRKGNLPGLLSWNWKAGQILGQSNTRHHGISELGVASHFIYLLPQKNWSLERGWGLPKARESVHSDSASVFTGPHTAYIHSFP